MKKLKLDLAQIQVDSFAVATTDGVGTVNAHDTDTDLECNVLYGTTTLKATDCPSCPYCLDEPIGP